MRARITGTLPGVMMPILTLLLCTLPPAGASGQQDPPSPAEATEEKASAETQRAQQKVFGGTITVKDSPIVDGSEIDGLGSLITTVSQQQIDDLAAQDLTSALRRVPGVVISRYNPIGAFGGGDGGAVFIRGHGSSRPGSEIATLTDGVPRFVGIWTHPLIDAFTIDSVDHADVYRSAQPVLLGNMSFGAVNMATKRRRQSGAGGRFVGSYGSFSTLIGSLEYGGRSETVDYYVTASHRTSDGHRQDADGEVSAVSGRLGFRLGEAWKASLYLEHTTSSVNDPGPVGAEPSPITPRYDTDNTFLIAALDHHHGGWTGSLKLYLDDGTFDWQQWSAAEAEPFRSVTDSSNSGVRLRESVSPWTGGELVVGLDHDLYGGRFSERHHDGDRLTTDLTFRNTAPYAMVSHTFAGDVTVKPSLGVRYNSSRYFGSEWGGQAGLSLGFGDQSLYANWAHAFNLPGVYAAVQYGGWGLGDAWQELEAETVDHLELGWLGRLGGSTVVQASLFRDDVENAIRFVPPPPPPPRFANIGAYTVNGIELSLQTEPSESLSLFIGGTFNDSTPNEVPNLPATTAVGGLTWIAPHEWRINVDLQWVDARYILNPRFATGEVQVDSYLLANARLGVPLRWLGVPADGSVFVFGENLTNEEYEHRVGYPMPGRMVQVGLEVGF